VKDTKKEPKKPRAPRIKYPLTDVVDHRADELLSFNEVAVILKMSLEAVRKSLYKEASNPNDLPAILRKCKVVISQRRTYIAGAPFRAWLRERLHQDLTANGNDYFKTASA